MTISSPPKPATYDWPIFDENTASSLCYTSGTTGNSKGVLYSHRSTLLHTWAIGSPEAVAMHAGTTLLPIVPMFHANAWGTIYAATMTGASIAMPGPRLDGQSLYELIIAAGATYIGGVPTVWMGLLDYLRKSGQQTARRPARDRRRFGSATGIERSLLEGAWSQDRPRLGHDRDEPPSAPTICRPSPSLRCRTRKCYKAPIKQGRAPYGVALKIIDDDGNDLPRDGKTVGELVVRGPWVTRGHYNDDEANKTAFTADGWFRTGDVATIDEDGFIELVDRVKDLIKSGGEWISSIDLENLALTLPGIKEAAAIPARHKKWDERPLVIAVREDSSDVDADALRTHLAKTLTKWMLPDAIIFVDELPHTATGKIMKRALRDTYADYLEKQGLDGA